MPVQIFNEDSPTTGPTGAQQCQDVFVFVDEAWPATNARTVDDGVTTSHAGQSSVTINVEGEIRIEDDAPFAGPYFWGAFGPLGPGQSVSSQIKGNPDNTYVRVTVNSGSISGNLNDDHFDADPGTNITVEWQRQTPGQTKDDVTVTSSDPAVTVTELDPATGHWQACANEAADATINATLTATNDIDNETADADADFTFGVGGPAGPTNLRCGPTTAITDTEATVSVGADNMPPGENLAALWGTAPGGPYPNVAGNSPSGASGDFTFPVTGLTPNTTYYYLAIHNGTTDTSTECSFTTLAANAGGGGGPSRGAADCDPPSFDPGEEAGAGCGGGGGGDVVDVEPLLLCDVDDEGNVLGSALAVYTYDESGAPTGPPTFVDPATGDPYVAQGTLVPCGEPSHDVEQEILCDVAADGVTTTRFIRRYRYAHDDGALILPTEDMLLDGSVYTPTGTVAQCGTEGVCTPSPARDLGADCGPGEAPDQQWISQQPGVAPDAAVETDPAADALCGGQWVRPTTPQNAPFPVEESFRNPTFDQPGPVTQGTAPYFALTADPANHGLGSPAIPTDGPGDGWGRGSGVNPSFTNGMWQVPTPFPTAQGMTFEATIASHTGTQPIGGDGMVVGFTDGGVPPQGAPIGGGGSLGMANWEGGYVGVVLDEFGGVNGQANTIQIRGIGPNVGAGALSPRINVGPNRFNLTTRAQPLRLRVSIIEQFGETYVSASINWNDGQGWVQYFDRERVDDGVGPAPATLRMGINMSSGGAFRSVKEIRDAVANQGGSQFWRQFPITLDPDPIDDCVETVDLDICVDHTFDSNSQDVGDGDPEAWLWLVNVADNTLLASTQWTSNPNNVGQTTERCLSLTDVDPADVPNIRVLVGAETREAGEDFAHTWDNLSVVATGQGCPAEPVRTTLISAPCPIPVTIVGGDAEGGGGGQAVFEAPATFAYAPICMTVNGETEPGFLRQVNTADGDTTVEFVGEDGIAVTPEAWTPGGCSVRDSELVELCDIQPNGVAIPFMRRFVFDESGATVEVENIDADGNPYTPSGQVTTCSLTDVEVQTLCDDNGPFFRVIQYAGGIPTLLGDTELDGVTPYVPVGTVTICVEGGGGTTTDDECLSDDNGVFFRRTTTDEDGVVTISTVDVAGNAYVPVGVVTGCSGAGGGETNDDECLQDDNGVFFRRTSTDEDGVVTIELVDVAGNAYVPVGEVEACSGEDFDFLSEVMCDSGQNTFIRIFTIDASTGAVLSTTDTDDDGSPYNPIGPVTVGNCPFDADRERICYTLTSTGTEVHLGWVRHQDSIPNTPATPNGLAFFDELGNQIDASADGFEQVICDTCCPEVISEGCLADGNHWLLIRETDGTYSHIVAETGEPATPTDILQSCPNDGESSSLTDLVPATNGGVHTISPVQLRSWSVRAKTAGVTIQVNGGPQYTMTENEVIESGVSSQRTDLQDTIVVRAQQAGENAVILEVHGV